MKRAPWNMMVLVYKDQHKNWHLSVQDRVCQFSKSWQSLLMERKIIWATSQILTSNVNNRMHTSFHLINFMNRIHGLQIVNFCKYFLGIVRIQWQPVNVPSSVLSKQVSIVAWYLNMLKIAAKTQMKQCALINSNDSLMESMWLFDQSDKI